MIVGGLCIIGNFKAITIVKPPGGFKGPPDECLRKSTGSVLYMEQPVSGNVRQVEAKSLPNCDGFKIIVVSKSAAKVNVNVVNWSRVSCRFSPMFCLIQNIKWLFLAIFYACYLNLY